MKFEFTAMISKQKPSLCVGSWKLHPDHKKKHGKFSPVMLTVLFDHEGVIHHENLRCSQMVHKEYYLKVRQWEEESVICGGEKNGCSIMTKLQHIPPFWFMILSINIRRYSSPSLCTHQTLHQQTAYF